MNKKQAFAVLWLALVPVVIWTDGWMVQRLGLFDPTGTGGLSWDRSLHFYFMGLYCVSSLIVFLYGFIFSKNGKRGLSPVISMLIITGIILTMVCSHTLFSHHVLEVQLQESEFEHGKSQLLRMADMVEEISTDSGPTAIHEIDIKLRTNRPIFSNELYTIFVGIDGGNVILEGTTGGILLWGGPLSSTVDRMLFGSDQLIVGDISGPLARVREGQSDGAWASLDFARVRITDLGLFWYFNPFQDMNPCYLNKVRISFINLTFGTIILPYAFIKPSRIRLTTFLHPENQFTILVMVGAKSEAINIVGPDTNDGQPVRGTIIELLLSNVEVTSTG